MVNDAASVNVGQGLTGQATTLFFLVYPSRQSLLYDPISRALQTFSHHVDLFSQVHRDMSSYGSSFRSGCHERVTPDRQIFLSSMSPDPPGDLL
jgi:hypothetical protein